MGSDSDPRHGSADLLARRAVLVLPASPPGVLAREGPIQWSERQSAFHGPAAASANRRTSRTTPIGWPQRESGALQPRVTAGRHRLPRAEVHLIRRLSVKRRMGKHSVVLLNVERDQSTDATVYQGGLNPVFFADTLIGTRMPNLTYMLTFPDLPTLTAHWAAFSGHPSVRLLRA